MKTLIIGTNFKSDNSLKTQGQFLFESLKLHQVDVAITSKYKSYFLRIADTILHILRLHKKDTIVVQVYSTKGIYLECLSVLLGWVKGCTIISTLHGGNIPFVYHTKWRIRKLLNLIFRYSTHVTVPRQYIPEKIPAVKKRFILIPNIIELEEYSIQPQPVSKTITIFWMRAYHPIYDPFKAIFVMEYLLGAGHDVELVMAGSDHGMKGKIMEYLKKQPYSSKVKLFGMIDNTQKNELAAQSNVYLSTNIIDNAPVSFLEMMAMGLPVVSTNIGGIPYYVEDHKTALLSKDNTVEDIANLIIELHQNQNLRHTIVQNGTNFIRDFSRDNVTQKWLTLLSQNS